MGRVYNLYNILQGLLIANHKGKLVFTGDGDGSLVLKLSDLSEDERKILMDNKWKHEKTNYDLFGIGVWRYGWRDENGDGA